MLIECRLLYLILLQNCKNEAFVIIFIKNDTNFCLASISLLVARKISISTKRPLVRAYSIVMEFRIGI